MTVEPVETSGDAVVEPRPDRPRPDLPRDVAGVPDTALRSALDFAIGIAAAGQKLRPPLVFPAALKSYLKLKRLDRMSLLAVRKTVAGDDDFRDRLGQVATPDLVDDLGVAWLRRDDGWQDRVRELHREASAEAEQATSAVALRKSERRREAAEQVAARANAELLAHHDSLVREQVRRAKAEDAASASMAQVESLRTEISGLRRELDKIRRRAETETARADAAEINDATARRRLAEVEAMRDEILVQRASDQAVEGPPVDLIQSNGTAARALERAANATRDLASALASAAEALVTTPEAHRAAPSVTPRPHRSARAPQRRPIAIPGGVYGDSLAAAEHFLRTANAVIIVDGYNVAKLAWPTRELIDQRQLCIDLLEDIVRRSGPDLRVIFDGAAVVGATGGRRLIRVQFSPAGVSADDVIRAEVQALPASTPVVVVTNDQAIVTDVRTDGANVISSEMLLAVGGRLQR